MGDGRCCSRPLIDTGYIGGNSIDHEAAGMHDWLDDGQFCCLNWPALFKRQTCWCKATRWVSRESPAVALSSPISPEQFEATLSMAASIAELAESARQIADLRI